MDAEEILLGNSIPIPEIDDEETQNYIDVAEMQYDFLNFINTIGTDEFKSNYYNTIKNILSYSIKDQISFVRDVLNKINDLYDFEFIQKFDLDDLSDFKLLYEFIAFLEFNNVSFLSNFWLMFKDVNILKIDIKKFLNSINDFSSLLNQVIQKSEIKNIFILEFLRTNNKENLISFILVNTMKFRAEVLVTIRMEE